VLAAKIYQQLMEMYGTDVISRQQVAKWCCMFPSGRDSVMESNQWITELLDNRSQHIMH